MREQVRRRRRFAALAVIGLLAVALAGVALTYTSVFAAKRIDVRGTSWLTAADVRRVAQVDASTNVFHLDTSAVSTRLEADPWIADASVSRHLPSRLVIDVEERTPVALTPQGGVIAADAISLPGADPAGIPPVRARVGVLPDQDLAAAARALGALAPVVRGQITAALVGLDHTIEFELDDGTSVTYGAGGDDRAKADALRSVLRWARAEHATLATVDVSVPSVPTATLQGGETFSP
jgi:cell division protein FtsQ